MQSSKKFLLPGRAVKLIVHYPSAIVSCSSICNYEGCILSNQTAIRMHLGLTSSKLSLLPAL